MKLYPHQQDALRRTEHLSHVAYFHDMGLGKTFTGAEKLMRLMLPNNLVICQKSKIADWIDHFEKHYWTEISAYDLTDEKQFRYFMNDRHNHANWTVGVINYELAWRRPELLKLKYFTLMLDESSLIQNERAKRTKFILELEPSSVILLSGTPTGGKYENLWAQMRLLGWGISRETYWKTFIDVRYLETSTRSIPIVDGYKNVDRLKRKMRYYGCDFLKTSEVFTLPAQTFTTVHIEPSRHYRQFRKDRIVSVPMANKPDRSIKLVGDTMLTQMLYERQLCGQYSQAKLNAFADLVESTEKRVVVFYNFTGELEAMLHAIGRQVHRSCALSVVNGKTKDLSAFNAYEDSVTFVQYQAGSMGLNLQKADTLVYYSPPLSSELYEQSKKRIHRIGQKNPCFYYRLAVKNSVEEGIYDALAKRHDYTEELFRKETNSHEVYE